MKFIFQNLDNLENDRFYVKKNNKDSFCLNYVRDLLKNEILKLFNVRNTKYIRYLKYCKIRFFLFLIEILKKTEKSI